MLGNSSLVSVLNEMNEDDFFWKTWLLYHHTLPLPVPNDCTVGELVPLDQADSSITSVIERGTLRIAIHMLGAVVPFLYSTADGPDQPFSIDLRKGDLDGYEIACAKEGTRRLGLLYNVIIEPEFVLSTEEDYFHPLVAMLNSGEADVTWSTMNYIEERADFVDFTCNNFSTEVEILASAKAGRERPDPSGPRIPIICNGSFCTFTPPLPFELYVLDPHGGIPQMLNTLTNTSDPWEYTLCTYDIVESFLANQCPECAEVDIDPIGMLLRKPATKLTVLTQSSMVGQDDKLQNMNSVGTNLGSINEHQQIIVFLAIFLSSSIIYKNF